MRPDRGIAAAQAFFRKALASHPRGPRKVTIDGHVPSRRALWRLRGEHPLWRKVKVRKESEFVIGGYTSPKGGRQHLGALLVGLYDGPKLRYVGKVGTGFTQDTLAVLASKLDKLRTDKSPFDPPPPMRDATWVRPKLVAQVVYAEWTADGKLRQPAFLGLRTDKDPSECTWRDRER